MSSVQDSHHSYNIGQDKTSYNASKFTDIKYNSDVVVAESNKNIANNFQGLTKMAQL